MERLNGLALTGATVYCSPEEEPLRDAAILVRRGNIADVGARRVVEIPEATQVIDCRGCAITAGFWNSHVHFHERKWTNVELIPARELESQLEGLTHYGFTSVFDLSSRWENTRRLRDRIESGEVRGPHIRSTGEGLIPVGGLPSAEVFRVLGLMETPLPEAIRAAVEEAHRFGKPVFAHPNSAPDVLAAIDGGVDIIAHTTPRSGAWGEDVVVGMKSCGAALVPTLMVWKSMMRHDRISIAEELVGTAVAQLRAWLERGGTVLFGTDLGAVDYDPSDEYALMAQAGATFRQILASLTTLPAQRFDASSNSGKIAVGNSADLVVLDKDPAKDVRAFAAVRCTLRAGEIIYRA